MKNKMIFRVLLTLALTAVLCLGAFTAALAAGNPVTGSETNPSQAAITKILQMPDGTVTPTETFTFTVTSVSVDGNAATSTNMPAIADKTVSISSADTSSVTSGIKSVSKETGNIFAGITWDHAGEYVYTIKETAGSTTGMTYSGAEYKMTVYVANGTGTPNVPYIAAIGTEIVTKDTAGQTAGDKVDPTPGTGGGLVFTNSYVETPTTVDPATDKVLSISKTVVGTYGDQTKYFPFEVTVNNAALVTTTTYKAYVMEGTTVATSTANYATLSTDPTYGSYIEVTAGSPIVINLKHGQWLSFVGLPVGTTYSVTEQAVVDYAPTASVVVDSATAVSYGSVTNFNTALTIGSPTAIIIGTGNNSADFTNTYQTVTPTGIILNNLPFIMMLVIAAGAFVAFVIMTSRKRAHSSRR